MSYIGSSATPLPVNFSAVQSQGFNGTGSQTTFTLNRSVGSAASVEVLVNNVQQSPYDGSYSITSGTSLVFSEAPSAGTNNVYVVYRDQALGSLTDTGAVRKAGDTMTGRLTISAGADRSIDLLNSSGVTQGYIGVEGAFGGAPSNALRLRGEGGVVLGANGTALLTCDSSGRVTMPYQPAFCGYRSAGSVGSTGGTTYYTYIADAAQLNRGSHYNTSNGVFTCPVAGVYRVSFFTMGQAANADGIFASVYGRPAKNGSGYGALAYNYGDGYRHISGTWLISCAANDTLEMLVVDSYGAYSGLCIELVG